MKEISIWSFVVHFKSIDDIAFELFAMYCGIGRGIKQRKSHRKNDYVVIYNKLIVSLESPHQPDYIAISSIQIEL